MAKRPADAAVLPWPTSPVNLARFDPADWDGDQGAWYDAKIKAAKSLNRSALELVAAMTPKNRAAK